MLSKADDAEDEGDDPRFRTVDIYPAHTPTGRHWSTPVGFIPEWGLLGAKAADIDDPRLEFDSDELGLPDYDPGDEEGWDL